MIDSLQNLAFPQDARYSCDKKQARGYQMANQEDLEWLTRGIERWNQWRAEDRIHHPNLSGANLRGATLSSANLSEANLSEVDLSGADLEGRNLSGPT